MSGADWIIVILLCWLLALIYWVVEFLKARIEESKQRAEWYRRQSQPRPATDGFNAITTEVQNLEGQGVDVTALKAAIDKAQTDVTSGVSSVTGLVPAATSPTDTTDTASVDTSGSTTDTPVPAHTTTTDGRSDASSR